MNWDILSSWYRKNEIKSSKLKILKKINGVLCLKINEIFKCKVIYKPKTSDINPSLVTGDDFLKI